MDSRPGTRGVDTEVDEILTLYDEDEQASNASCSPRSVAADVQPQTAA